MMIEKWHKEFIKQCNPYAPDVLKIPKEEWLLLQEEVRVMQELKGRPMFSADIPLVNFLFMGVPTVPV